MRPDSFEAAAVCALWNSGDRDDWEVVASVWGPRLVSKSNYWLAFPVILHPDGTVEPDPSRTLY